MHQALETRLLAEDSAVEARLQLRVRRFILATNALGCESDLARAKLLKLDPKTIGEARRGGVVGERFISNTVVIMRRNADALAEIGMQPTIDEFFEVVEGQADA